jgi:uncharacterized membrane protein
MDDLTDWLFVTVVTIEALALLPFKTVDFILAFTLLLLVLVVLIEAFTL